MKDRMSSWMSITLINQIRDKIKGSKIARAIHMRTMLLTLMHQLDQHLGYYPVRIQYFRQTLIRNVKLTGYLLGYSPLQNRRLRNLFSDTMQNKLAQDQVHKQDSRKKYRTIRVNSKWKFSESAIYWVAVDAVRERRFNWFILHHIIVW